MLANTLATADVPVSAMVINGSIEREISAGNANERICLVILGVSPALPSMDGGSINDCSSSAHVLYFRLA